MRIQHILTAVLIVTASACIHALPENPLVVESFESPSQLEKWEARSIEAEVTPEHATEGNMAVKLEYPAYEQGAEKWPAFILHRPEGIAGLDNWKDYSAFRYDIYVEPGPGTPDDIDTMAYKLRVDDIAGTRWTTAHQVPVGKPYTIDIPFQPDVGFGDEGIAHLDFFMSSPEHAWTIYLDNIRFVALPLRVEDASLYPDPFHLGSGQVRASLSARAHYRIEVRDEAAEVVRHFTERGWKIDWTWDGLTDEGAKAPAGRYTVHLLVRTRFSPSGWALKKTLGTTEITAKAPPEYVWWPLSSVDEVYLWSQPEPEQMAQRDLSLKLARNEYEATQVAIRPRPGLELNNVEISVEDLTNTDTGTAFSADGVTIYQVGHVETHAPPPPYDYDFIGWHPDPLIEADTFDIADGDTQAVWIQLHTARNTEPGEYRGTVVINPDNAPAARIPFGVTVWDFQLPDISHCKTLFDLRNPTRIYPDRPAEEVYAQYRRFVFEHRINPWRIYNGEPPDEEFLKEYISKGMNAVNLLKFSDREFTEEAAQQAAEKIDPVVTFVREKGWTDVAYFYGFDETRSWDRLRDWADWIQERYPDIKFSTTSRDSTYGVQTGIENVDAWVPLTPSYDRERADARRQEGYEVWWYICIGPHHPYANWFIEYPLIEARLLWWMTYQYNSDGFLYYAINRWPVNDKPLEGAPRTDWDPASYKSANGDGCLFYGGPEGPITGMRFETVRDGLEEYEYFWLLEQKLGDRARGEQIAGKIIRSLTDYTRDPQKFMDAREILAQAILDDEPESWTEKDRREWERLPLEPPFQPPYGASE